MKALKFKDPRHTYRMTEYVEDIDRIVRIAEANGYALSQLDAKKAWEAYSDSFAAGWLILGNDDEAIWDHVCGYLEYEPQREKKNANI